MPFNSETGSEAGKKSSREGIPNKMTALQKQRIAEIIDMIDEYTTEDIEKLKPVERQKLRAEYSEFVTPKLFRAEQIIEMGKDFRDVIYDKKNPED